MNRMHSATVRSTLRTVAVLLLALTMSAAAAAPEALAAAPAGPAGAGPPPGGGGANFKGPHLGRGAVGGVNGPPLLPPGPAACAPRAPLRARGFKQFGGV